LLAAEPTLYLPGMALTRNLCNLDPSGYHQVFLHFLLLLLDHFDLSFAEMIGVQSTMEHMHFTSLFFVLSAKTLLACLPRGKYQSETVGYYGLGHLLLKLITEYHGLYRNRNQRTVLPYMRYSVYFKSIMPTVAEWHSRCDRKVAISLCFWNAHSQPAKSKSTMKKEYVNLSKRLKDLVPNCGDLGISHSMSVMSELGLLPSWIRNFAVVNPTSTYMTHFLETYYGSKDTNKKKLTTEKLDGIVETLRLNLENRFKIVVTPNKLENILCKTFRFMKGGDSKWSDLYEPGQNLFRFEGDKVEILMHRGGAWKMLEGSAIINEWGFGDVLADLPTIVDSMKRSRYTMNFNDRSLRKLYHHLKTSFKPSELLQPNVTREFDFEFNKSNKMRAKAVTKGHFLLNKIQLSYYYQDT
jgi:hypothetical protein